MQFSQDLDADTKRSIEAGQRLTAVLRQKNSEPMPFEQQAVSIYAAVNDIFTSVVARVRSLSKSCLPFTSRSARGAKKHRTSRDLAAQTEESLKCKLLRLKRHTRASSNNIWQDLRQ